MSIRRTLAIVLRQIYLIRATFSRVFPLFAWIVVDMVLWGFLTKYLNTIASPGFNFVPVLLGAVLLWDFFIRIMQGVTMAFFEDVWSRNFLNIFATPLLVSEYVAGLVVTNDVSARDLQLPKTQFYEAKSYPTFTPVGPRLVLLEPGDWARFGDLCLRLWVNGEVRQDSTVADMLSLIY